MVFTRKSLESYIDTYCTFERLQELAKYLLNNFYMLFYFIYQTKHLEQKFERSRVTYYGHCLYITVYTIQLISLTIPTPQISDRDQFKAFLYAVSMLRPDFIGVWLGIGHVFYCIVISLTSIITLSTMRLYTSLLRDITPSPRFYRVFLFWPLYLIKRFALIPCISILLSVYKHSTDSMTTSFEYFDMNIGTIRLSTFGQLSVLFIVPLSLLILFQILYGHEQDISKAHTSMYSRAHSRIELLAYLLVLLMISSHFYLHEGILYIDHIGAHLGICLGSSVILSFLFIYFLPYYDIVANFTHASAYGSMALFVTAQGLSWFLDDISILLVFFIFLTPVLVYLIWTIIQRRLKYIKNITTDSHKLINSIYTREIYIRLLIQDLLDAKKKGDPESEMEDIKSQIKTGFKVLRKEFKTCKLVSILEFLYTFNILEDENLARLKLSFTMDGDFDLEYNYGEFKCRRLADDSSKQYSEEIDYIKYRRMYDAVMSLDEKSCNVQLEFWNELSNDIINVKRLESLSYSIHRILEKTHKKAKELYKSYPENGAAIFLYGSFLKDIYNNVTKGNELIIKSENIKKVEKIKQKIESRFSFFYENSLVMIISGSPDSVGIVEYVSPEANNLLGLNAEYRLNLNISSLLPPPMNDYMFHTKSLIRFLETRESTEVGLPITCFMMTTEHFLVEIFLHVKCLAWDSYPFFLVSLKKVKYTRECFLLDDNYCITAHTKHCNNILRLRHSNYLIGMHIDQLIPGIVAKIERLDKNLVFEYDSLYDRLFIRVEEKLVRTVIFKVLYISNSIYEAKCWSSSNRDLSKTMYFKPYSSSKDLSKPFMRLDSDNIGLPGILKKSNRFNIRKNLKVKIEQVPTIHLLPWSDFEAGKYKNARQAIHLEGLTKRSNPNALKAVTREQEIKPEPSESIEMKALTTNIDNIDHKIDRSINSQSSHSSIASNSIVAQRLISSVNGSIKRFKVAFLLKNLVLILTFTAMITYLILCAKAYKDDTIIPHACALRSNTVTLTEYARYLHLQNVLYQNPYVDQELRGKLAAAIEDFEYRIGSLEDNIKKSFGNNADSLYKETVPTFVKEDTKYVLKRETLIDALRNLILESKILLSTPAEHINATNPHFYYIFRNGVDETAKSLNDTVNAFLENERESLKEMTQIVYILGGSQVFLLLVCFIGVIVPTIIKIEKANQDVWAFFYNLNVHVINDMKSRFEERLETFHGKDQVKKNRISRFKNIDLRNNIRNTSKWKGIIFKLSIYYIISAGLILYLQVFLLSELTEVVNQKTEVLNWGNMIITSIEEGFFWGTEVSYLQNSFGYFSIVPEQQSSYPYKRVYDMVKLWDYSESLILTKYNLAIKSSEEQQNILFVNGCHYLPCDQTLEKGLHAALINIRLEVPRILNLVLPFDWSYWYMVYKDELNKQMKYLLTLYEDILNDMIEACMIKMKAVVIIYCLVVMALYIFLYLPSVNKTRAEVTSVWNNTKLIPYSLIRNS